MLRGVERKLRRKQVEKESRLKKKVKRIAVMQPQLADRAYYLLIPIKSDAREREPRTIYITRGRLYLQRDMGEQTWKNRHAAAR